MAGGNPYLKTPQKGKNVSAFDSAEVYKAPSASINNVSSILNGVLTPGETISFNQEIKTPERPIFDKHIEREQAVFINDHQKENSQSIENIRNELKSLIPITENLESSVTNVVLQNISEANDYQLNFLERIKSFVIDFRKNTSDSNSWVETSNRRKNKRNAFWNKAKSGGQKYLESGEHTVARSAN